MVLKRFLVVFVFLKLLGSVNVESMEGDRIIFQAMEEEMSRSLKQLKVDVFDPPYFMNYQIRHHDHAEVAASFGAIIRSTFTPKRTLFVDVRVGDEKFDSSVPNSHRYHMEQFIPIENDLDSLRRVIWYETDLRYKQAIVNFLKKKGRFISGVDSHSLPDFSRGKSPQIRLDPIPDWNLSQKSLKELVRSISRVFRKVPDIEKSQVKFLADRDIHYYYDSDGNKIREANIYFGLLIKAWTKTEEGSQIHDQKAFYFSTIDQIPSKKKLIKAANELISSVKKLKLAPRMDPYVGPAIFSSDATAVLFHEAIGHRLEGDRLRNKKDGKTFLKKVGEQILPEFISIKDDPTIKNFDGKPLLGHFHYDDQGQESEEVVLIDHGKLKGFLLSRTPILGFSKTNGHARGDGIHFPTARMGNFFVRSENTVSDNLLKNKLIEEVIRQGKPYGLIVKKIVGGETHTESDFFQVFKGKPLYLVKVYPDGKEEMVRGVDFVGTPLSMISKILVTGKTLSVVNGFCAAESGNLPVTSITPSILLSEVELQSSNQSTVSKPILPAPLVAN